MSDNKKVVGYIKTLKYLNKGVILIFIGINKEISSLLSIFFIKWSLNDISRNFKIIIEEIKNPKLFKDKERYIV